MKINIGSKNNVKIEAVREVIQDYDILSDMEVEGRDVESGISEQPINIDETIQGAINRARNAYDGCEYSFGIEDGLIQVQHTKTGYMNICACVIYDGQKNHLGLSSAFEYPRAVIKLVLEKEMDISQAFNKAGITKNTKIGSDIGAIGILTHGRLIRKDYTKQAIMMALIHLENAKLFD